MAIDGDVNARGKFKGKTAASVKPRGETSASRWLDWIDDDRGASADDDAVAFVHANIRGASPRACVNRADVGKMQSLVSFEFISRIRMRKQSTHTETFAGGATAARTRGVAGCAALSPIGDDTFAQ